MKLHDVEGAVTASVQGPTDIKPDLSYCTQPYVDGISYNCTYPEMATSINSKSRARPRGRSFNRNAAFKLCSAPDPRLQQHGPVELPVVGARDWHRRREDGVNDRIYRRRGEFDHHVPTAVSQNTVNIFEAPSGEDWLTSFKHDQGTHGRQGGNVPPARAKLSASIRLRFEDGRHLQAEQDD